MESSRRERQGGETKLHVSLILTYPPAYLPPNICHTGHVLSRTLITENGYRSISDMCSCLACILWFASMHQFTSLHTFTLTMKPTQFKPRVLSVVRKMQMAACQVQAPAKLASQSQYARFYGRWDNTVFSFCKLISGLSQLNKLSRPLLSDCCTLDVNSASI